MATIDIRDIVDEEITLIRVWDDNENNYRASGLTLAFGTVNIFDAATNENHLGIESEEHAKYLIKALNKAIELGWFKE